MDYTIRDLARYAGFIAGCSVTYAALGWMGIEAHLGKLVVGIIAGLALGYVGDRVTEPDKKPKGDE